MNHCDDLLAYLADDLSHSERSDFADHLGNCARCRNAIDDDRRGRELVAAAVTPVSDLARARLAAALRSAEDRNSRGSRTPWTVAVVAATILIVASVGIGHWTDSRDTQPTATAVMSKLVDDADIEPGAVATRSLSFDGHPVVIAESSRRFPMPSDATPAATSTPDLWLVQRDGINVVCQNGPTSRLIASTLPAAQLVELVASGQLG